MALVSLILTSLASLAPVNAQDITSTICAKRSAVFYTSGSSTYVVSPWPSSAATSVSNPACSVTATLPPVTTTVYASSPTASQPGETVVNESFENGTSIPFQTSTSSSNVSAQVAQGGPVAPNSGANYLYVHLEVLSCVVLNPCSLVTYNVSSPNSDNRLQSAGPNVNVYNLTQSFNTTSGVSYTVSASSKQASNGAQQPDCTVQICADAACGPQTGLTPSYQPYSYTFVATSAGDTVAILSYSCTGPAYVGVDDVAFSKTNGASSSGAQTVISYITTTLVQTTTASGQSSSMAVCPSSQFALAPSVSTVTLPASTVTFTPAAVTTTVDFTTLELATATLTNTNTQTTTAMGPTAVSPSPVSLLVPAIANISSDRRRNLRYVAFERKRLLRLQCLECHHKQPRLAKHQQHRRLFWELRLSCMRQSQSSSGHSIATAVRQDLSRRELHFLVCLQSFGRCRQQHWRSFVSRRLPKQ